MDIARYEVSTTMRLGSFVLLLSIISTAAIPAVASSHRRHTLTLRRASRRSITATKPKIQGQRTIGDERATQIQTALIKARYLSGEPSGHWDAQSQDAIRKVQADNGWQTKLVPDSRALIKLGLGPDSDSVASASAPVTPGKADPSEPAITLPASRHP